jgi:methionyl aminopeptidase
MLRLKAPWELAMMRTSGRKLAEVVELLRESIQPGMSSNELDELGEAAIRERGGIPSFLGYRGGGNRPYPASLCISVNHQVVHGVPGDRVFRDGDVVSIDLGLHYAGYHADRAFTVVIGKVDPKVGDLLDATRASLYMAIAQALPGNRTGDIGHAVESFVEPQGYSVIRDYVGHGIGKSLHEEPAVPNYGRPGTGVFLETGLCIAIEPMVSMGSHKTKVERNGWTVVTRDGATTAHFEHSIAITEEGPEILTTLNQ